MGSHTHQPDTRTSEPQKQHFTAPSETRQPLQDPATLAAAVGNRQFQDMVAAGSLRPQGPATPPRPGMSPAEVAQEALQQRQPRMLLSLNGNFAGLDDDRRAALIELVLEVPFSGRGQLLNQLWSGWPETTKRVVAGDPLWARSAQAVPALMGAPLDELRRRFISDVRTRASEHLDTAFERMVSERDVLLRPQHAKGRISAIRQGAQRAHKLLEVRKALLATPVGWIQPIGDTGFMSQALFNPQRPPTNPYGAPRPIWEKLKADYDWIVGELSTAAAVSPIVSAAISTGDVGTLVSESDSDVTDASLRQLDSLRSHHKKARAALDQESLNWFDLVPIHQQLLAGETAASGTNWGTESLRVTVGAMLERHDRAQWMTGLATSLGVTVAATVVAALSGGTAVPLLAGAAAIGYGGSQTYRSWKRADAMEVAHAANAGHVNELVTADAAAEARFEARLNLLLSAIDGYGIVKGTRTAVQGRPRSGPLGHAPSPVSVAPNPPHASPAPAAPQRAPLSGGTAPTSTSPSRPPAPGRSSEPTTAPMAGVKESPPARPSVGSSALDDIGLSLWKYAREWVDRSSVTGGRWPTVTGNRRFVDNTLEIPTRTGVVRVAVRINARRAPGQNADVTPVASSESLVTRGSGPNADWEATIDIPLVGNPDEKRYALGRELDTITGTVLKGAPDATVTEKVPGLFGRNAAGTPTSRDIALVRELAERLADLRVTENAIRDGGTAGMLRSLADRTTIQRQEIAKLTREMGFDDPHNLSAKLEALGNAPGLDSWVYFRDELVQRGLAPILKRIGSLPGVADTLSDTVIANLYRVSPSDPKGSFVRDGLSGGRVERELRAFVEVRQEFALVEIGNRKAGGTAYRLYDQYRWVGDGRPPRPATYGYPKPTGPVPPGWEKSEREIASVSDLDVHLTELAAALKTGPKKPSDTVTLTTETGVPVKVEFDAGGRPTAIDIDPEWFR